MGDRNRTRPSSNNQVSSSKNFRMNKSDTSPKSLPARQNSNPKSMNPNRQEKRNSLIRNEVQDWSGQDGGSSERRNSSKKVNMNHLLNCTVKTREDTNGRAFTRNPKYPLYLLGHLGYFYQYSVNFLPYMHYRFA